MAACDIFLQINKNIIINSIPVKTMFRCVFQIYRIFTRVHLVLL